MRWSTHALNGDIVTVRGKQSVSRPAILARLGIFDADLRCSIVLSRAVQKDSMFTVLRSAIKLADGRTVGRLFSTTASTAVVTASARD